MDNPVSEYIFEITAKRIKNRILSSGLRYIDIYPPDDKLICKIANNNRGKNNPYLIPDTVLNKSENEFSLLNTEELNFKEPTDVLWGTNEEIRVYAPTLFSLLIELIKSDSAINFDIDSLLCDYIPYARICAFWDVFFSNDHSNPRFSFCELNGLILNFPAFAYGVSEDEIFGSYDKTRDDAISFLYNRCCDDFIKILLEFTKKTLSFKKIDKVIKKSFVIDKLVPMLINYYTPDSSLGLRVKHLIYEDISYIAPLVFHRELDNQELRTELLVAALDYAVKLEEIQASCYKKRNGTD